MTRNFTETITEIVESLQNKTLVVTTIMVRSKWSAGGSGQNFYISVSQSAVTFTTGLPIFLHYITRHLCLTTFDELRVTFKFSKTRD